MTVRRADIRLGWVSLDRAEPSQLAAFYARLLGVDVGYDSAPFAALRRKGIWLSMQRVERYRPPAWPAGEPPPQVHLDLAVDDLDQAEAAAVAAGATKAADQPSPERWRVMLDSAGHPFCLSTLVPE